MRKLLLFISMCGTILSLWGAAPGWAACALTTTASNIAVAGNSTTYPTGTLIVLTATPSGCTQPITQVAFYNGAVLLGIVASPPYSYVWNTAGLSSGPYNVSAVAAFAGSVGPSTSNWTIDVVGDAAFTGSLTYPGNPGLDPSFGEAGAGTWLQGDSQLCLNTWPYNGSPTDSLEDGSCAWNDTGGPAAPPPGANSTVDSLDDTVHMLSDFITFSNTLLSKSVGTLSSTFQTWYPQLQVWITPTCDDGGACTNFQCGDGTQCNRLASVVNNLNTWDPVITKWLGNNYANANAWCIPSTTTGFAVEDNAITNNGTVAWGSMPSIVNCLNYNATVPVSNYQACLSALQDPGCPATYAAGAPPACAATTLGRSLAVATPAPAYDGCTGAFAQWVQSSLTLATDESPKFTLRAQYLNDIYSRALAIQPLLAQGATALQNFVNGPAAQLASVQATASPTQNLPNAVIYGWQDALPSGGSGGCLGYNGVKVGCSHIVKVLAYSTARCGGSYCSGGGIDSLLPWIKTKTSGFLGTTRSYTLTNRDGYVYVSVKRWDQNHSSSVLYPNGRTLWQFLFQNPKLGQGGTGQGIIASCVGLPLPTAGPIGFGLLQSTLTGLGYYGAQNELLPQDVTSLSSAFMLNDRGIGNVDPSAAPGLYGTAYNDCLVQVNQLLANSPESHACAKYVASINANHDPSNNTGEPDYSVKFVDCNTLPNGIPPDDLTGQ